MKPIKLQMSYFGPFEEETIDFSKVQDQMFLISGRTGSGKTMIFDAITFALYGEASTSDRNEQSVRSQFATEDDISRVALSFSIRHHTYKVERELSYQKDGNKSKVPNKAVLYDEDGNILSSQVRGVTEKIIDIVKLSVNQFRQILILPQGEFKRLLLSRSEEKQSILRTLFQTERFVRFEETLKSEAKEQQKVLENIDSHIDGLFQSVIAEETLEDTPGMTGKLSLIEQLLASTKRKHASLSKKSGEVEEEINHIEQSLKHQEEHNAQLSEFHNVEEKIAGLETKRERITTLESLLKKYHLAAKIQFELKKEREISTEIKAKKEDNTNLRDHYSRVTEEIKHQESIFRTLQDQQEDMKKVEKWLTQTERFLDEKYKDLNDRKTRGKKYIKEVEQDIAEGQAAIKKSQDEINSLTIHQTDVDQSKETLFDLEKEQAEISQVITREEEYVAVDERIEALTAKENELKDTLKKAEAEYDTLENALQNKYLNDEKVHIEHLLEHLKVGAACPVCQQTVKEIPESISYLTQDEEQKIEALREHQERIKTALETNDRELYAERKTIEDKERIDLKYAKEKLEQLTQTIKKTTEDFYSKKSALQQLDETKEKLHVLEKGLHDGELKLQNYQTRLNEVTNLQQDFTDVTQFQEHSAFKEAFYDRKDKVDHYFEEFDAVKSNIEKSASERVKIEERLKLIAERLEELAQNFTHYEEMVTSFLEEYQFSSREDLWTALQLEDSAAVEREIQTYYEEYRLYHSQLETLKTKLKSLEMYDLTEGNTQLEAAKAQQESLLNRRATLQNTIKHNENIHGKMSAQVADFAEKEQELNHLIELSNVVAGKNHTKVSLERYVLTYYLERILSLANKRLLEMTHHRYALVRSTSKMNRQTGLDIEVFDYYNNSKRHITSLSGGETFQASLTLALAMNEALQQESGGISLDTMLIDEGFGTLDAETLDTAINTLIDLQSSGKTIGVISHVGELKERMENILYVSAHDEKSSTYFNK